MKPTRKKSPPRQSGRRAAKPTSAPPARAKPAPPPTRKSERPPPIEIPAILLERHPPKPAVTPAPAPRLPAPLPAASRTAEPGPVGGSALAGSGTGSLLLAAREPRSVYAHWDFTETQLADYRKLAAPGQLALRLYPVAIGREPVLEQVVPLGRSELFLTVEQPDTVYIAEFGYVDAHHGWVVIATSPKVRTPPEAIATAVNLTATLPAPWPVPAAPEPAPVPLPLPSPSAAVESVAAPEPLPPPPALVTPPAVPPGAAEAPSEARLRPSSLWIDHGFRSSPLPTVPRSENPRDRRGEQGQVQNLTQIQRIPEDEDSREQPRTAPFEAAATLRQEPPAPSETPEVAASLNLETIPVGKPGWLTLPPLPTPPPVTPVAVTAELTPAPAAPSMERREPLLEESVLARTAPEWSAPEAVAPQVQSSLDRAELGAWTREEQRLFAEARTALTQLPFTAGSQVVGEWAGGVAAPGISSGPIAPEGAPMGALVRPGPAVEVSSPAGWPAPPAPGRRPFWMNVNAELIVYGATEPDARVTVAGRLIQLRPDGSFSFRFALPDGEYVLPIEACAAEGMEMRRAVLCFARETDYLGGVSAHPQEAHLRPPG